MNNNVHGQISFLNSLELKIQVDSLQRDHEVLQLENQRYKEKVEELEKWIVLLTNNFYAGNPGSVEAIQHGLDANEELRQQVFQLKKTLLFERKK